MPYNDLRDFIKDLEKKNLLKRVKAPVTSNLEMTEIMERLVQKEGVAVLFENVEGSTMPVLANLYGTEERIAMGLGSDLKDKHDIDEHINDIGKLIAYMQRIKPPKTKMDILKNIPEGFKVAMAAKGAKKVSGGPCQQVVKVGNEVNLDDLPIQHCWPGDIAPLITWGIVVTNSPDGEETNLGIYRCQKLGKDKIIMRWLAHRGGAKHQRLWHAENKPMPVAIAIGCEPGLTIAAVTPVPEDVSEYQFAGILRKKAVEVVDCKTVPLKVPATAEIIIEGFIQPDTLAPEGPYADHTGYYNSVEDFPVMEITAITHRKDPIYLTTMTGRPPKEDARIGVVLNKMYLPSLKLQFPEVVDFSLPMEAVSYRIAIISIKKEYPGHAKRIMMGLWGILKQFLYVKYIIVVDEDIDVHNWDDVIWAISTRVDPVRDSVLIENTPIDYLDFSSPKSGLGGKMGIDATNKIGSETDREWGEKVEMTDEIKDLVTKRWEEYGLDSDDK